MAEQNLPSKVVHNVVHAHYAWYIVAMGTTLQLTTNFVSQAFAILIVVMRDNQRAIVLGKGGSKIKAIGEAARKELTELLGQKVHMFLHVKTDERWSEDKEMFEEMGLDWKS